MKRTLGAVLVVFFALALVGCERFDQQGGALAELPFLKSYQKMRASSYDKTGGNDDGNWKNKIQPGETRVIADLRGPGAIDHIWFTIASKEQYHLKKIVLRMYWDGEENPSVEVPIGDFFGLGLGEYHHFWSEPIAIGTENALNCYWRMPFTKSAKITVTNEGQKPIDALYYNIDWRKYKRPLPDVMYFHAQYRQAYPCKRVEWPEGAKKINKDGKNNYVFMEARGHGHYVGVTLSVRLNEDGWWGEGDEMIFIDGDSLPRINGTGSEDYFCGAWGFGKPFWYPYFGCPVNQAEQGTQHKKGATWSVYRFHIPDPIPFTKSIRVTMEHGHANDRADDWSSVAYWYQTEPHQPFPPLPPVEKRIPRVAQP